METSILRCLLGGGSIVVKRGPGDAVPVSLKPGEVWPAWDDAPAKHKDALVARYGLGVARFIHSLAFKMPETGRSLYVRRNLLNGDRFAAWAKGQGFKTTLPPEEMHATVCYSKGPVDWAQWEPDGDPLVVQPDEPREIKPLGKDGAVVLRFGSRDLAARHQEFRDKGATWDHPSYQPHVTITYDGGDVAPDELKPFPDALIFGPEVFEEIDDGWSDRVTEKLAGRSIAMRVVKTAPDLQIAYGWASVVEKDGKPVVDSDNEVVTEADLDSYVRQFVLGRHGGRVMHEGPVESELVESMMFTKEKQEILGIDLGKVGWWVGFKYHNPETWARIKSGELPMFSLAGYAVMRPFKMPADGE